MNCSALVPSPVDAAPIRSPQAVHTALLRHFADREVIEIGTRNGDAMACFSQHTRNATAIDLDPKYCDVLRQRSEALRQAGGRGFEVLCSDYRKTAHLDVRALPYISSRPKSPCCRSLVIGLCRSIGMRARSLQMDHELQLLSYSALFSRSFPL